MNKKERKLNLRKETIRELASLDLHRAAGAATFSDYHNCGTAGNICGSVAWTGKPCIAAPQ